MPLRKLDKDQITLWSDNFSASNASSVLGHILGNADTGRVALVSSFGAESIVLLHMLSRIDAQTPVLFIDTEMLFPETLEYQLEITRRLQLTDVRVIRAVQSDIQRIDPENTLHITAPDLCCDLRKTHPLQAALADFDTWITGRKHFHKGQRAQLPFFEDDGKGRLKVNPLIHWSAADVAHYIEQHELLRHPLVKRGYSSIGCTPCTTKTSASESMRAGRWRGLNKQECGIHFSGGKALSTNQLGELQ